MVSTLPGYSILSMLFWVGIFYPLMAALFYSEGDLTVSGAFYLLGLCILGGIIFGLISWFSILRPFIKRVEKKRKTTD